MVIEVKTIDELTHKMPKISIIANFYKSEAYIPKLIESVICQTYKDWELICVNDCSPMNDLKVIEKYASKDNRILIVNNRVNLGISKAKFEGIKHAKGEYLMFIDGDDWLEPEALQKCIEPAETYNVDMVIMSSQKVLYRGFSILKKKNINPDCNRIISQPELFDKYFVSFFGVNKFQLAYWGKLIRKSVFDEANLKPSELIDFEDLIFNMNLFPFLRNLYMLDYVGHNWRWGGITSGKQKTTEKRVMKLLDSVLDFYDMRMEILDRYHYEKGKKYLTIELVNYLICNLSSIADSNSPNLLCIEMIKKYVMVFDNNKSFVKDCCNIKYDLFRAQDISAIYNYCHQEYKRKYIKRTIKRIIHKVIE